MTQIRIYQSANGSVRLDVLTEGSAIWLTREQLAGLFDRDVKTIGKHVANALREELSDAAVVAKFATTAADGKIYNVEHYSLDMVLSVGYRVKSAEGVHFRRWANEVLRDFVVAGAAINERRLAELEQYVSVLSRSTDVLVAGSAQVLSRFLPSLRALRDYDNGSIEVPVGDAPTWILDYVEARAVIDAIAAEFPADKLFGIERGDALRGVVETIYQGFAGQELYPSV
ncbi:MAG: RhuM family protein [Microbacteriaceae bacterium]